MRIKHTLIYLLSVIIIIIIYFIFLIENGHFDINKLSFSIGVFIGLYRYGYFNGNKHD